MHIFLYFIIIAGILQIAAVNINQPGNSDLNQLVEAPQNACQQGYFFNEQICSQCQWIENGFCTCSQQGKCDQITCLQGYFLVGSSCIKHPDSNCIKGGFNSNGSTVICYQCSSQSTLIGGICIANNNCLQFDSLTGICKQCQSGYFISVSQGYQDNSVSMSTYYVSLNQCQQCISNCLECQNEQQCKVCSSGYFVQDTQCIECKQKLSHCLTCETASRCISCDGGFYLNINQCLNCSQQINNCQDCSINESNQLICSSCKVGSFLSNNQCPLCSTQIQYCQQCQNSTICQVCYKGFYLSSNRCKMCSASIQNCLFCSDQNNCQICGDGYYLQDNICIKCSISIQNCGTCKNSQNCTGCLSGYYLDQNNICQICSGQINNCSICINSQKCDKCINGYYWDGTNCSPCTDKNCTECSNNQNCSTCLIGFSTDGSKCSTCTTVACTTCGGQSYLLNGQCLTCSFEMNGCSKCGYDGDSLKCFQCLAGYAKSLPNQQPCQQDSGANCNVNQFAYGDTCKSCSQGIANCLECSYQNQQIVCKKCNDGYDLGGTCEPCQKSSQSSGQSTASSSSSECQKCAQGTYFDNGSSTCKTCSSIQNCSSCSDANTCTNCIIGYYWNNTQCVLCAKSILNCYTCSDNQTCTSCVPGFILDGNQCYPCSYFISNCLICKTNAHCLQCDSGNYLNTNNTCSTCDDSNCINCNQSSSQCTSCVSGTYLNGTQCKPCSIINKCIACLNNQKCTACSSGTFLKNDQCTPCDDQNCINCNDSSSNCTKCIAGYYINNQTCSQCSNSCSTCLNNTQCTSCKSGYYLNGTTCTNCSNTLTKCLSCINESICTNCDIGSYLDGNSCTNCPISLTSCNACKSNTICISCNPGSYLNGSQCSTCTDKNCLNCTQANTCTSCAPTYIVQNNTCIKCIGYSNQCTACSNGYCSSCINNYLIQSDGSCLKCPDNCAQGCSKNTLQNSTICQICQDQYYLNINGLCIKCPNLFLRCIYDTQTQLIYPTQCIDGYFLVNKSCIQAQQQNTCSKLFQPNDGNQINSSLCQDCWPSYLQNSQICYKCDNCADNSCSLDQNNNPVCSLCTNFYYSDSNQICQKCITNCYLCTGPGIQNCQQCNIGYYKTANQCIACTTDNHNNSTCLNCLDEVTCSICIDGYYQSSGQCLSCQYGCRQCASPGNVCIGCISGFYLQNGGCVQDLGNCLENQQNENTGCSVCAYGFYPVNGWLSQSGLSQVIDNSCLQCVYPQAAFVCRANPSENQIASASLGSVSSIKNTNYFKAALPLSSTRLTSPQCKIGSFWSGQSCMPCPNVDYGICAVCNNFTICNQIQCNPQYYLITLKNSQQCVQIPTGCSEMQFSDKLISIACTKCNSGYTLIGNICISINGCLTIDQNNGACTQCTNGYYFNWDFFLQNNKIQQSTNTYYYQHFNPFCSKCNIGCALCPSQYTCTQCLPGYFWYQSTLTTYQNSFKNYTNVQTNASGQCIACPKNCLTCSSVTVCTTCNTNFQIDPNSTNGDCICISPYTYNQNDQTCIQLSTVNSSCSFIGCIQCNSDNTQCQACSPQYTLVSPTVCTQCLNCNSCSTQIGTSNPTCLECADGYYKIQAYDGAPITCQLCSQSLNNSLRCQGLLENQTQLTIIQCTDNYYLFGNVCYSVGISNCYTIANSNIQSCQQCLPGYILYGNICDQCNNKIQNCLTCTQNQDQSGFICQSCVDGYVLNTNTNQCQQCPNGCQNCQISNTIAPYSLTCNTCANGNYIDIDGNCLGCPFYCKSCDSKYICKTCNDGYYLIQSSIKINSKSYIFQPCYPCQNNCATCTGPYGNICLTCQIGFVLQSGGCINLTQKILNDPTTYSLANCYTSDSSGCTVCLAGFFLDSSRVCQQCVSPYSNFVCGLEAISPTNPTIPNNQSSGQYNTSNNTQTIIEIGINPIQPNSLSQLLAAFLIFIYQ